ncbi:hypothetical protein N836_25075 [Leptolyngbya sp. Heron Island J]|uniref:hypothetical protein n=1 Tax=Leptolyngbya sp. Heron Island J TaxID=1385935 RepID=UPI0003B9ADDF|nr:hypothetical protein [Leptolyngbya sp. Heron Island J]ESA32591.1 hypothetical protein N836_25075 [Leptolyngbya sp. Heron Island J]
MFTLWIVLALLTALGLMMLVSASLLQKSLAHEGLCPVCGGSGGPCKHCNGFGIIVDASKSQSSMAQNDDESKKAQKSLR